MMQPAILSFGLLQSTVPFIQILVTKQVVIQYIPLPTSILKTRLVAFAREIQPFWMPKFVAHEIQVSFATQSMCEKPVEMLGLVSEDIRTVH